MQQVAAGVGPARSGGEAACGKGALAAGPASDLYRVNRELLDLQGRSERIKNFPYPHQHAFINSLFVWILCILLPFRMIGEFERLNDWMRPVLG